MPRPADSTQLISPHPPAAPAAARPKREFDSVVSAPDLSTPPPLRAALVATPPPPRTSGLASPRKRTTPSKKVDGDPAVEANERIQRLQAQLSNPLSLNLPPNPSARAFSKDMGRDGPPRFNYGEAAPRMRDLALPVSNALAAPVNDPAAKAGVVPIALQVERKVEHVPMSAISFKDLKKKAGPSQQPEELGG